MRLPEDTGEQRLMLHPVGSVAALTGIVPLTDYCGAEAGRSIGRYRLARAARPPTRVSCGVGDAIVTGLPGPVRHTLLKFCDSLTAFMHAHEATIANFLRTVTGKEEWELRAHADLNNYEILEQLAGNISPDWQALPKGTRYMRLCRDRGVLVEQGRAEAVTLVHDFVAELQPLMAAVRQHVVKFRPRGGGSELVARYALLVAKKDVTPLQESVREAGNRASHQHIAITLSGPWPLSVFGRIRLNFY